MDPDPDADPDPAIFVIDLQDTRKRLISNKSFSASFFLKVRRFTSFFKDKKPKRSHKKVGINVFLPIFA